jgi:DNA-binding MarR family transcriptional regulator
MTTSLVRRDPPKTARGGLAGATTPLDFEILAALGTAESLQLREIKAQCDRYSSTHQVHALLMTLAGRGLVQRIPRPGGPRRGPGASTYQLVHRG